MTLAAHHDKNEHDHAHPGAAHIDASSPGKKTQVETAHAGAEPHAEAASSGGINMKVLQDFIAKHEGYVDHVYRDSRGFPTAGIGHLLTGSSLKIGQKVSAEQITAWFKSDVAKAIAGARKDMGSGFDKLNEARQIVVIDMVFNLGTGGFGQFHQTIHAMNTGNFAQAATNMLQSLWASQVGHRATEDAAIMRSGHMSGVGKDDSGDHKEEGHHDDSGGGKAAPSISQVRQGHGVLKVGEHGPAVKTVQHLLHVSADGIFGPHTRDAVEKFQHAHHLHADGIIGEKTLHALEHKAPPKKKAEKDDDGDGTGGVKAPDDKDGKGDKGKDDGKSKDGWTKAPTLEAVKSGAAELHIHERGGAVKHVQRLLSVADDGEFGPQTRAAVLAFQHDHDMKKHDGKIDDHTLEILEKHPVGSIAGESRDGSAQRSHMLSIARSGSVGRRPDGRCYYHVCQFLVQCGGYGKIKNPYTQFPSSALPLAHDFADLVNSTGPARWGLQRVSIHNPYDAPPGSIVVVAAGSPGTHHPTAGDIAVADGHGAFYNGGMMGYSGRAGWDASKSAHLLGCYIPA